MSLDVASIVALTLCLCTCTSAVNEEDFLGEGPTSLSLENEPHEIPLPSFGENFIRLFRCRDLGRMRVFAAGRVTFLPSDLTAEVNNLELDVFKVDDADINKTLSSIHYRTIVPDRDFADIIREDFDQYFPRRSIEPDFVIVVTWDLKLDMTHGARFQCIIVFDVNDQSQFVIYQYLNDSIQWDDDATFPSIGARVCGGEDSDEYVIPDSGDSLIIERVKGEIIPDVPDRPQGKVAFLIGRGIDPDDGETVDEIFEHIPCPDNLCSLDYGYCKVANVCTCNGTGWTGSDCKTPNCPNNPCVNGTCTAPHTCSCNTGYTNTKSANNCSTLQCDADNKCKNGVCLADPLRLNECDCPDGLWTGDICDIPICAQTCVNGACTAPGECTCNVGWTDGDCTMPTCDPECQYGTCVMPNMCECPDDRSGATCADPFCDPTCGDHGTCMPSNNCECTDDYTGNRCEIPPSPPTDPPTTTIPSSSPDPSSTSTGTAPTDQGSTGTQLSAGAIGGIVGGIVGFVILLMIMGIVIIGAFCAM